MAEGGLPQISELFTLTKILSGGGYGTAYLVKHKHYGEVVFKKIEIAKDIDKKRFQRESEIHMHLRHPNIVNFLDVYSVETTCGLFIEYMKYGDAMDFIEEFDVTWQWKTRIVQDVAQAMVYLHSRQPCIIHGDLKPQNILIDGQYFGKVSDFGLASFKLLQHSGVKISWNGTFPYIAPEYLEDKGKQKTSKFDVYGFAISVWEIYSGKRHSDDFKVSSARIQHVINGTRPLISDITCVHRIPASILNLIEQCWNKHDRRRPSFGEIICILSKELYEIGDIISQDHIKKRNQESSYTQIEQIIAGLDLYEGENPEATAIEATKVEIKTDGDREQFLKGFNAVWLTLLEYIDPENGLLECLIKYEILTISDYNILNDITPYKHRNGAMIVNYIKPKIKDCCKQFVDALVENKQEHIVTHIMSSGMNQGEDRLLTDKEIEIIDNNMFGLVNLIHPYKMEFLYRLVSKKCITNTHKEKIESHKEFTKKVDELLTILKRRRYRDLCSFKQCLHDTMQHKIVELFEKRGLVAIHVKLIQRPDISFIESALIAHMTDYVEENNEKTFTPEQKRFVGHILKQLEIANIRLLGTFSWQSMAVFFMCSTTNSVQLIRELLEAGELLKILEKVYRVFYKLPDCATNLIENITLHEMPFQQFSSFSVEQSGKLQKSCNLEREEEDSFEADKTYILDVIRRYNDTFNKPVVSSCSVDQMIVHVRIAVDGCVEKSLSEHQEALSEKLVGYRVKVEQLSLPKPTTHGPGQQVILENDKIAVLSCYIEAGEQKYALLAGNTNQVGDTIFGYSISGDHPVNIGQIVKLIREGDRETRFCDVAVAQLTTTNDTLSNHILDDQNKCFHLDVAAGEVVNDQVQQVQLFRNGNVNRQKVKLRQFHSFDETIPQLNDCVEVLTVNNQQIHEYGESGVLLTSIDDESDKPNVVKGLVMLTGLMRINECTSSIGQSLSYILERIRSDNNFKNARLIGITKCRAECEATEKIQTLHSI